MARPRKKIDPELVRKLASIHCTYAEMAAVLHCSEDTLERRFAGLIKDSRQNGLMSLRRKQFELALGGNTTMCIWLGKQLLGQRDKTEQDLNFNSSFAVINRINGDKTSLEARFTPDKPALESGKSDPFSF